MKLYIMRHGPAEPAQSGQSDADRALTAGGRAETTAAAKGLSQLGVAPAAILTSPLKRALQTAEIVADELDLAGALSVEDELTAGTSAARIVDMIRKEQRDLLLVGHNPDFSELVSYLLTDSEEIAIDLNTAGVVCLEFADSPRHGAGTLRWYLRRKQLAMVAGDYS